MKIDYDVGDFQVGETVRIISNITDILGEVTDPATITITVRAPDRTTVVDGVDMTRSAEGSYYHDYLIPADTGIVGIYTGNIRAVGSTNRVTMKTFKFRAVKNS